MSLLIDVEMGRPIEVEVSSHGLALVSQYTRATPLLGERVQMCLWWLVNKVADT
jgi:hypothetical protein